MAAMQQSGEHRIAAPRAAVWQALNDPEILKACIEGCEELARTGDGAFEARVRARIGPLSAVFTAEITLEDVDPPNAYTLRGAVKGGAAGFGKGAAKVALSDDGAGTLLRYEAEGSVGGKLAQIGQRLVDAAARKMADDFFTRFSVAVAPMAAAAPTRAPAFAVSAPVLWIGGGVLALLALLASFIAR
jgi:carbon monoxide dehydrogenase subunit G